MLPRIRFRNATFCRVAPLLVALAGCSDNSSSFSNLSATNNDDDFFLVAQAFDKAVSTTLHYPWSHSSTVAQVIIGFAGGATTPVTGTATIMIRDAAGTQVYSHDLKDNVTDTTAAGMSGNWSVDFSFGAARGDIVVEVRRAQRDLTATTTTTGSNLDADGYTIAMDGVNTLNVAANGSVTYEKVTPGSHTVVLSGLAGNCSATDGTSRTTTVPAGIPVTVSFSINCL
jgi:hypothetical protein